MPNCFHISLSNILSVRFPPHLLMMMRDFLLAQQLLLYKYISFSQNYQNSFFLKSKNVRVFFFPAHSTHFEQSSRELTEKKEDLHYSLYGRQCYTRKETKQKTHGEHKRERKKREKKGNQNARQPSMLHSIDRETRFLCCIGV